MKKLLQEDGVSMQEKAQKNEAAPGLVTEAIMEMRTEPIIGIKLGEGTEKATEAEMKTQEATPEISSNVLKSITANMSHVFVSVLESVIPKDFINKSTIDFSYSFVLDDCDKPHDFLKLIEKRKCTYMQNH